MNSEHALSDPVGTISAPGLAEARAEAATTGLPLVAVLEKRLGLPPAEFASLLGRTLHYPVLGMDGLYELKPAFDLLPYPDALENGCFIARQGEQVIGVFADPFNTALQARLEARTPTPLGWHLASAADVKAYLALQEEGMCTIEGALGGVGDSSGTVSEVDDLSIRSIAEDTSPVVKLVNSTIYDAMHAGASDIHLESSPGGLLVKYRVDGVLCNVATVSGVEIAEQTVSRIKVMAELDIAEKRVPQDGRFKLSVKGREIDFRISIMPSLHGEDVVVRILDKRALTDQIRGLRLDYLGFDERTLEEVRQLAAEPYGMLLVTGPTGSGKTTTLYAALSEINTGQDKIITIEDPVEYQLPGILQIPVNEKKGLTFARGLRSILRHDPDKILVGEIRDPETAQIAVQSALTGHLVFTSVHANNTLDVLGRFLHMGVDTYSFVSALNGILAQRLVRVLCPECAAPYAPAGEDLRRSGIAADQAGGMMFRRGRGCGHCRGSGYKGRKAIGEVLALNDEIRELIVARAPIRSIKETARANGTRFLREAALDLVRTGKTSLEEINRVTFVA